VFRLAAIFTSIDLLAPVNTTVMAALFVCALSVSGAMFLILEMDTPFEGLIQISKGPLRDVLGHLGWLHCLGHLSLLLRRLPAKRVSFTLWPY
jgi:hypothetical protein